MDFIIERIPNLRTAFMRRIGAYGSENFKLMTALKEWADLRGLLKEAIIYGIAYDGVDTPPENCRYDVCLVVSADYLVDGAVQCGEISAGKYAIFTVSHTAEAVQAFWNSVIQVLNERGLQLDSAKPISERYKYLLVEEGKIEFCVPILE